MLQLPKPFANKDQDLIHTVVETPKGSRNKYNYQPETGLFFLKRILPAGTAFPLDFGFVPGTQAPDGDPLDVLLLSDAPCVTGSLVRARVLGIIEAEQQDAGDSERFRNDRLVAVADVSREYHSYKTIEDLGAEWLRDITQFFAYYHGHEGGSVKVLAFKGPQAAIEAVKQAVHPGTA